MIKKFVLSIFVVVLTALCPFGAFASQSQNKICLAYCTYYGDKLPDPNIVTHINYAFAELYVVDGVYKTFKLQGNESLVSLYFFRTIAPFAMFRSISLIG